MKTIRCQIAGIPPDTAYIRDHLHAAMHAGLEPAQIPADALVHSISVMMPDAITSHLQVLSRRYGHPPGVIAGMLLAAEEAYSGEDDGDWRPEQAKMLKGTRPLLEEGKIVLAEGGTGVGKSRVIASLAYEQSQKRPVAIAAPAIHNILHLVREWHIVTAGQPNQPEPVIVLGRGQFVDRAALEAHLETMTASELDLIREWIGQGYPPGKTRDTASLANAHPHISGLLADLQALAPDDFPVEQFLLNADSDEESSAPYDAIRALALRSNVVFCTHAMLAVDARLLARKRPEEAWTDDEPDIKRILNYRSLLIDEAHLLESNIASACSSGLSLMHLRQTLDHLATASPAMRTACAAAQHQLNHCIKALQALPDPVDHTNERHMLMWGDVRMKLGPLHDGLSSVMTVMPAWPEGSDYIHHARSLRRANGILREATRQIGAQIEGASSHRICDFTFSPVRRWPTAVVGPRSVSFLLKEIWNSVENAALFSGTLCLPAPNGGLSTAYIRNKLAIPEDRAAQTDPVHPSWRFSPVIIQPSADLIPRFKPPRGKTATRELLREWLTATAMTIRGARQSTKGGTLVLMSGYDRAKILASLLPDLPDLLLQSDELPMVQCRERFIAQHRAGNKPIWIATGTAWTGLDLRDESILDERAYDDLLLTDLIVPNLPHGIDQSTTQRTRIQARGSKADFETMALTLKQGMGRLMRRDGLKHRRIWMLDTRLQTSANATSTALARQILREYPTHETFGEDMLISGPPAEAKKPASQKKAPRKPAK